jgi:hypothetical protein
VSAPARVAEHLRRVPDGPAAVLHHTATALYVAVAGRCVGVVAPGAAQVPCALRLADPRLLGAARPRPYVERGTLLLTDDPLEVRRFVDVRVPRIDTGRLPRRAAGPAHAERRLPRPAASGLAALGPLPSRLDAVTLHGLIGRGDGLTPLGDDVVCGWVAALVAAGRLDDDVSAAVRGVLDRTTLLSATLLDCALHGEVLPEFTSYVAALGTPREDPAAEALMRIGHTSGAGLWWGARHALELLGEEMAAA